MGGLELHRDLETRWRAIAAGNAAAAGLDAGFDDGEAEPDSAGVAGA
jgi:hypothetical protein